MRGYAGLVVGLLTTVLLLTVGAVILANVVRSHRAISAAGDFVNTVRKASESTKLAVVSVDWNSESNILAVVLKNVGDTIVDVDSIRVFADGVYYGVCGEISCSESIPDGSLVPGEILTAYIHIPYKPYRIDLSAGKFGGRVGGTDLNNWYVGCKYRRLVLIENPLSTDLNSFQVPIDLGPYFDYSHDPDGNVVVTTSDGITVVPAWVEFWNDSGNSRVWVRLDVPASASTYVYLYYGCSSPSKYLPADVFVYDLNILAYWPLDGNGSDVSGLGHDLNAYGVSWVSGWKGQAAYLDGGTDSYFIRYPFSDFPESEIAVVFRIETNTTQAGGIFSYAAGSNPHDNEFLVYDPRDVRIYKATTTYSYRLTGIELNDGVWHLFAVTWRSSDGNLMVYKDGTLAYENTLAAGYPILGGGSLVLGQEQDSVGDAFDPAQAYIGTIDEVMLFSTVLTPQQISAIYSERYFVSPYYLGHLLIRKRASSDPVVDVRQEEAYSQAVPAG